MMRWWWFGAAVEKPEILRELQQMKADGIGGAELAFVYPQVLDDPAKDLQNLPFLSPGMLDAVRYAQSEGRKLGLRIDVTLCSGWPYGGPATTLAEAASRLRTIEVPVAPHALVAIPPALDPGDSILSASIADLLPVSNCGLAYGDVCGSPIASAAARIPGSPTPITWNPASATPIPATGGNIAPSGKPRVALFFIASHTKQQVKRAAVGAEGYVLDPFSHQAVVTPRKSRRTSRQSLWRHATLRHLLRLPRSLRSRLDPHPSRPSRLRSPPATSPNSSPGAPPPPTR